MYYTNNKFRIWHLLSVCIALTLFHACTVDDISGLNYDEVSEYANFFGDANNETVILHAQGGPMSYLDDQGLIDLISPVNTNGIIVANVVQRQMGLYPAFYIRDISDAEAKSIVDDSVDDLADVVRHFKSLNKKVYVMGQDYGAYLIQELIAKYGSDIADSYLVLGSRLTIEEDFTDAWSAGDDAYYDFGATPAGVQSSAAIGQSNQNLNRLFGYIGQQDYMSKLRSQDLSKLHYMHTANDDVVGPMDKDEISFLAIQKANVLDGEGSHEEAVSNGIGEAMSSAFGLPLR